MNEIRTRIQVGPDRTITGIAPPDVPPGEHVATITISTPPTPEKASRVADLPVHDTPWDGSISLRREDMYGDDGR
jgi:hypothetical protein